MQDIYARLVRRYDDSHQMLESAQSWRFFGWPMFGGGLVPLIFLFVLARTERTKSLQLLLQAIPPWAVLCAFALCAAGLYMVVLSLLLDKAARWARKSGHF